MNNLAKILVYGDIHLSSKNYGAHNDYPKETLDILRKITKKAEEVGATHIIGLGDFAYGRFNTLEYREAVENELIKQNKICGGNRYEIKGNHDKAGYGMTEYEYYIRKGLLKPATNLDIGNVSITMVNYGEHKETVPNIKIEEGRTNVILAHDYFTFKDAMMPFMGKSVELDEFERWFGVDYLISGHIHTSGLYDGMITKNIDGVTHGHRLWVEYLGSMSRPSYMNEKTDEVGHIAVLNIYDDHEMEYDRQEVELLPISEAFNLTVKEKEKEKEAEKRARVDISDIVVGLDKHERSIGNPEDIINALQVNEKYKEKAIELLKASQA